jgi:hypothetical protein
MVTREMSRFSEGMIAVVAILNVVVSTDLPAAGSVFRVRFQFSRLYTR